MPSRGKAGPATGRDRTRWTLTFLTPGTSHPSGGVAGIHEFANAMSRRGHDVHLVHIEWFGYVARDLDDLSWSDFEPGISHHFHRDLDVDALPPSDFVFCFDGRVPEGAKPLMFVQAHRALPDPIEAAILAEPCPKICISRWLTRVVTRLGVPEHQAVRVPYGLRHDRYRLVDPPVERTFDVALRYNAHPIKGSTEALEALAEVRRRVPTLRAVLFDTGEPIHDFPPWVTFQRDLTYEPLVRDVYNASRVFLTASVREGFCLTSVEAMACGCALVTTDNGGSREYARHEQTALVCEPGDVSAMAEHLERLLLDEPGRSQLADAGRAYIQRYTWDRSATRLDAFLSEYAEDPDRYRQPNGAPGRPARPASARRRSTSSTAKS